MESFKKQIDVNYYGYVYVTKAFLPLMKADVTKPGARRGRFAYVSSGPLPGPGVPFMYAHACLLSVHRLLYGHLFTLVLLCFSSTSYLGAKWAGEALCQGLRMEMRLRQLPIGECRIYNACCVLNNFVLFCAFVIFFYPFQTA